MSAAAPDFFVIITTFIVRPSSRTHCVHCEHLHAEHASQPVRRYRGRRWQYRARRADRCLTSRIRCSSMPRTLCGRPAISRSGLKVKVRCTCNRRCTGRATCSRKAPAATAESLIAREPRCARAVHCSAFTRTCLTTLRRRPHDPGRSTYRSPRESTERP